MFCRLLLLEHHIFLIAILKHSLRNTFLIPFPLFSSKSDTSLQCKLILTSEPKRESRPKIQAILILLTTFQSEFIGECWICLLIIICWKRTTNFEICCCFVRRSNDKRRWIYRDMQRRSSWTQLLESSRPLYSKLFKWWRRHSSSREAASFHV